MLQPVKKKFRKEQKGRNKGIALNGNKLCWGSIGMKALSRGLVTAKQIESARRAITNCLKRGGKVIVRIFPDKPVTKKPAEVRMGNGKGDVEFFAFEVKPGRILYEVSGVDLVAAAKALKLASAKLPLLTTTISSWDESL